MYLEYANCMCIVYIEHTFYIKYVILPGKQATQVKKKYKRKQYVNNF